MDRHPIAPLAAAMSLTGNSIQLYTQGELYGAPLLENISGICIDSRKAERGELFIPLSGERTDGHFFIEEALQKGCPACLINRSFFKGHEEKIRKLEEIYASAFILVDDTLKALQQMALKHLDSMPDLIRIGITGSSGKTTTKEMIGAVLSHRYSTAIAEGNFNSEVGLCLAALKVRKDHTHAVFEMGMNRRGEMDILAEIVKPDYALITNIGTAHIGLLGSREQIAKEKKKIFSFFGGTQIGFIREDESFLSLLKEEVAGSIRLYGETTTPGIKGIKSSGLYGTEITYEENTFILPLPGKHNCINALGAISLCRELMVSPEDIAEGLKSVRPEFGRSEIIRGPVTVIQDCYNANPESVSAALSLLDTISWEGKKIVVLGDMKELGDFSASSHRTLLEKVLSSRADRIFLLGEDFLIAYRALEKEAGLDLSKVRGVYSEIEELISPLKNEAETGDLVLVKGSRSLALEAVVEELINKEESGA